jgi:hypothetical protein
MNVGVWQLFEMSALYLCDLASVWEVIPGHSELGLKNSQSGYELC